ncbi:WS/DGAT/MGAT family O-acyltransferase [Nocardia alba]|uniref:Diacylglycerol O-acyltransferase n=1 Tax=Nocardia alba TaxID=225051 RepID=A0A4R1FSQ2_9NOCA|nr:wax ester/triacylglycerol synthase family O-acyltransferase [Nocardia alba]TCJ96702.1 diacylglycerol O-acyltransferase [Nocardia alba]
MPTSTLNPIDVAFLWGESDSNLMNIAHLDIFRLPPEAGPDFVSDLVDDLRTYTGATSPFDRRLDSAVISRALPRWVSIDTPDLDYHLRRHVLPAPGGQRELGDLVSRLHGIPMDRSHPLWQLHVIEGLDDGRLALYIKGHHALLDGVATVRLARKVMSNDPDERGRPAIWAYQNSGKRRTRRDPEAPGASLPAISSLLRLLNTPIRGVTDQLTGLQAISRMYGGLTETDAALIKPYTAPPSILNGPITAERRIATQSFDMNRISILAQRCGGTINDVIVAICAGGLRRYLAEIGELPKDSLIAGMPMSFRPKDSDDAEGNATTMALATLATDIDDVRERVSAIVASTVEAKAHMSRMSSAAVMAYTAMLMAPFGASLVLGVSSRITPMFNVIISNMPGPSEQLHYNGMALEEWHAVSIPLDGQALNITILSYANRLNLCVTACATSLPHVQRVAPYCADALAELERAYLQ